MLPHATIIYGDGTDRNLLDEEGWQPVRPFALSTGMDEENILLALHAGRHSRAKLFTKVNRVNFEEVIASMPIGKVIRPKQTTAELISQYTRAMQNSMGSNVETCISWAAQKRLNFVLRRTTSPVFPCRICRFVRMFCCAASTAEASVSFRAARCAA